MYCFFKYVSELFKNAIKPFLVQRVKTEYRMWPGILFYRYLSKTPHKTSLTSIQPCCFFTIRDSFGVFFNKNHGPVLQTHLDINEWTPWHLRGQTVLLGSSVSQHQSHSCSHWAVHNAQWASVQQPWKRRRELHNSYWDQTDISAYLMIYTLSRQISTEAQSSKKWECS